MNVENRIEGEYPSNDELLCRRYVTDITDSNCANPKSNLFESGFCML
jgi:hypothetical protein